MASPCAERIPAPRAELIAELSRDGISAELIAALSSAKWLATAPSPRAEIAPPRAEIAPPRAEIGAEMASPCAELIARGGTSCEEEKARVAG